MEAVSEQPIEYEDEKMSSLNHSELQSRLAFLFMSAYRQQYSIFTELDLEFASGKTRPDLCIFPKRQIDWMTDEIIVHDVPAYHYRNSFPVRRSDRTEPKWFN